jgi:hypothetical protein
MIRSHKRRVHASAQAAQGGSLQCRQCCRKGRRIVIIVIGGGGGGGGSGSGSNGSGVYDIIRDAIRGGDFRRSWRAAGNEAGERQDPAQR